MDKKYDHQHAEQTLQKEWEQNKVYSHTNNPGTPYSIDTPPPTVSGSLHIGHVFSYTQTDILARHKRMSGYSVFYPFGFDNNGLPTERFVEKTEKTSAFKIGRSAFIKLCLEKTEVAEKQFKEGSKKQRLRPTRFINLIHDLSFLLFLRFTDQIKVFASLQNDLKTR